MNYFQIYKYNNLMIKLHHLSILRGTRNLSLVPIRFRLFDEKRRKNNLKKFDKIDFETKESNEKPI